jgi:DNA-binding NarL/FixJ family response regulator
MTVSRGPTDPGDLRVLVVADDHLARAGLAALLADQPQCTVSGQVSIADYEALGPEVFGADVAAWDLGWEPDTALGYLAETQDGAPPSLALVTDEDSASKAWNAGARGLLKRDADGATIYTALRSLAHGLSVIDPDLAGWLASPRSAGGAVAASVELTPRETEVLGLIADGLPNKAISLRLDISEHTVKFHVNAILNKLGAQSRTEAVVLATRIGLLAL